MSWFDVPPAVILIVVGFLGLGLLASWALFRATGHRHTDDQ